MAGTYGLSQTAKDLIQQGDKLFGDRLSLVSLWQEVAEHFYPERADFTMSRTLGEDFASHLNSSYPLLVRRELGDAISAMVRRKDEEWGKVSVKRVDRLDNAGREWLEFATTTQRAAMYDPDASFQRATKSTDHDYVTFGNGVISQEINWKKTALLYRNWHLRDIAWCEDESDAITDRHHKVRPSAFWLAQQFGEKKLHHRVQACLKPGKDKYQKINCRRIVLPADHYDDIGKNGRRMPWVSIYIDADNECVIDERTSWTGIYIFPGWQKVSGSQYAFSPAVIAGLPDARLIQAMTLTILEAGEMAVRPPLTAVGEAIQGGVQIYPGGVTQVDATYDERQGRAVQPIMDGPSGLPFGIEILERKEAMLARAFSLNKLRQLPQDKEITAYEASILTKDYIREVLPLFEPLESVYNAPLCEQTFEDLMRVNAFGPWRDIPQSIRGLDTEWQFKSPLTEAIERQKAQKFAEAKALIREAMELDPSTGAIVDARIALRESLNGIGVPSKWLRSERAVELHARQVQEQQAAQAEADQMQQGAEIAATGGKAVESLAKVA